MDRDYEFDDELDDVDEGDEGTETRAPVKAPQKKADRLEFKTINKGPIADIRNAVEKQKEKAGLDVPGRTGVGRDAHQHAALAPFLKMAKQNGTTVDAALHDYADIETRMRANPATGVDYMLRRLGYTDPAQILQQAHQLGQSPQAAQEYARHNQFRANTAIQRAANSAAFKYMREPGAMEWMGKYIDADKAGTKAFCDAQPDVALQKAYKAYITHRVGQNTVELRNKHYSADTEAHRKYQKELAKNVAGRMR